MIQVTTELRKLATTRAPTILLAVAFAATAARIAMVLINAGKVGAASLGTTAATRDLLLAPGTASIVFLILGVVAMTTETRYGTITWAFLANPARRQLVAAKALAVLLLAVAFIVIATALTAVAVVVVLPRTPGTSALLDLVNAEVALVVLGTLLGLPLWAMLGVAVGAIIRNQVAAVVVPLVWFGVVENLLPSYGLRALVPWLPGGATASLARADVPGLLSMPAGAALLIAYVAALGALGVWALQRRDVT